MLRALGIAFIICTFLFGALIVVGAGWWAVSSGNVRITGINNQPATSAPVVAPTASAFSRDEFRMLPSMPDARDSVPNTRAPVVESSKASAYPIAETGLIANGNPFHFASASTIPAAAVLPALSQDEEDLLAELNGAELVRATGIGSPTGLTWKPSVSGSAFYFPSAITGVVVDFRRPAGIIFSDGIDKLLNTKQTEIDAVRSESDATAQLSIDKRILSITYAHIVPGRGQLVGLTERTSRGANATIVIAADDSSVTYKWLNNLYERGEGTNASDVEIYGDFLKLHYDLTNANDPQFYIARLKADGQPASIERVTPVKASRLTADGELEDGLAVQFQTNRHFAGMRDDETAQLFILATKPGDTTVGSTILTLTRKSPLKGVSADAPVVASGNHATGGDVEIVGGTIGLTCRVQVRIPAVYAVLRTSAQSQPLDVQEITDTSRPQQELSFAGLDLQQGPQFVTVDLVRGQDVLTQSKSLKLNVLDGGPRVQSIDASAFTLSNDGLIRVQFDRSNPVKPDHAKNKLNYALINITGSTLERPRSPGVFDQANNTVELQFSRDLGPGQYDFKVFGPDSNANSGSAEPVGIVDVVGGKLVNSGGDVGDYSTRIAKNTQTDLPLESRGISGLTGKQVEFPEYTKPREYPSGFNPSDKVVTRVARLYYFRDAHRVSQIVNRNVKSYNRATVDMKQQFADAARTKTDNATDERRSLERKAVRSAQEARASENALEEQQQALINSRDKQRELEDQIGQLDDAVEDLNSKIKAAEDADDKKEKAKLQNQKNGVERNLEQQKRNLDRTDAEVTGISNAIRTLLANVQAKREEEIRETERWEEADAKEQRAAEDQFRREVAAKTEDPDTYAPGNPESNDPVTQVSISVVGEGLIQLRGPRKGVNEVHKIINQLDAPVGQVKVAIHTVQVNGEHGDRLEKVVYRIQRYLDHSRFLTIQSAQMLRNAVVLVASRRAAAVSELVPAGTPQELRDYKYQEAFFGQDFIQELRSMDSEFLKTGNKVLSLSSMDSTSLSNAMFLLSLAKNDVREEILQEFMASVRCKLPADEMEFFLESGPGANRKRGLEKLNFLSCDEPFQFLGQNARFTALRGFFDAHVEGSDTLNPLQREFVRLAQIFKARLITEVELRQRVMERSLIEERIGNVSEKQEDAVRKEQFARTRLAEAEGNARRARSSLQAAVTPLMLRVCNVRDRTTAITNRREEWLQRVRINLLDIVRKAVKSAGKDKAATIEDAVKDKLRTSAGVLELFGKLFPPERSNSEPNNVDSPCGAAYTDHTAVAEQSDERTLYERITKFITDDLKINVVLVPEKRANIGPLQFSFDQVNYELTYAGKEDDWTLFHAGSEDSGWEDFQSSITKYAKAICHEATNFQQEFGNPNPKDQFHPLNKARDYLDAINSYERDSFRDVSRLVFASSELVRLGDSLSESVNGSCDAVHRFDAELKSLDLTQRESVRRLLNAWIEVQGKLRELSSAGVAVFGSASAEGGIYSEAGTRSAEVEQALQALIEKLDGLDEARIAAEESRRPLDHKKFLDMLVDDVEEKFIELVEGTRAQTSNIDNYLKRLGTALEDDFNAQFYHPAFRHVREQSYSYDVSVGQIETTSIVANNRMFAKVSPQATMEFDLPKRDILINEAMNSAMAAYNDYGALMGDPNFLSLMKMYGGQSPANTFGGQGPSPSVQNVLPGLPSGTDAQFMSSADNNTPRIGSNLEALIPDPAVYKFETGTGYEVRPVIQPDGQSVVFHLDYMFSTNIREPVRADEKHLGRVKRHFINTDVVSGNYELREVSTYRVGLKASRTSRGVPLLEDVPGLGVLFRPQPSAESSLQQNIILSQTVIYPTLFDLMGLRWAPAVADLDSLSLQEREFVSRNREKFLQNEVFDYSSLQVDEFMRVPEAERRGDLYRTQESIPRVHPNSYQGSGLNIQNGQLQEGYSPEQFHPQSQYVPRRSEDAQFSVEQPPRSPVLKVPSAHGLNPQNSGYSEGFVPGTTIPLNSFEGAMPVDPSCIPGQLCPPQHGAMRNDIRLPNTAWPADAGDAKPLLQSSFQQPESVPTLKQGWFCPTESSEPEDQSMSKILPPVTQIHRQAESRTTLFSRRVLGLPGRLMKKLAIRESDSDAGVVNLKPAPGDRKDTTYSQMSRMPR